MRVPPGVELSPTSHYSLETHRDQQPLFASDSFTVTTLFLQKLYDEFASFIADVRKIRNLV